MAPRLGLGVSSKLTAGELPSSLPEFNVAVGCIPLAPSTIGAGLGGCKDDPAFLAPFGTRCLVGDSLGFVPVFLGPSGGEPGEG